MRPAPGVWVPSEPGRGEEGESDLRGGPVRRAPLDTTWGGSVPSSAEFFFATRRRPCALVRRALAEESLNVFSCARDSQEWPNLRANRQAEPIPGCGMQASFSRVSVRGAPEPADVWGMARGSEPRPSNTLRTSPQGEHPSSLGSLRSDRLSSRQATPSLVRSAGTEDREIEARGIAVRGPARADDSQVTARPLARHRLW